MKQELDIWIEHHKWWIEKSEKIGMPLHFFRFEDVLMNPQNVLDDIFGFMLEIENVDGTVI